MTTTMFEAMMTGLNEVEGFLAGARTGYKVSVPTNDSPSRATGRMRGPAERRALITQC
jgi:hypothetical protein